MTASAATSPASSLLTVRLHVDLLLVSTCTC